MIRTEGEGGTGKMRDRKFQFIKLLSILRTSSYLRPSYLLFSRPHIFLSIAYRSLFPVLFVLSPSPLLPTTLSLSFARARTNVSFLCAYTHTPRFHLSISSCSRHAVPIKRENPTPVSRGRGNVRREDEECPGVYRRRTHTYARTTCIRTRPVGGSSHTSSGGSPSHVLRGENVPPACRKGR